ncbi:MBL fold metallo-hydrolase [Muricoccus pecuniae]|uniref:L-ascorbate metabolism protein UlaG (Beta-lactamase superfamily) n=1 Tax=Muricoccus pecuniae TaxID=693023 RepID=A0A840YI21_9PROT|nr:MBL fold metallo-hydrolase [Roseomonas pecuniae]MBB5693544.1 L-ascorbate metabolism protein UlaG (beta-lactamase superfamily) [Roseomonas pecuniae]
MRQGARKGPDGRFLNPDGGVAGQPLAQVWRMMREGAGTPWPRHVEDPAEVPPAEPPPGHAAITFIGHASFLIRVAGGPTLLTDPIWSERCSPLPFLGPRRARRPALALDALPPLDAVLLSHNHYDHLDVPTLRRLGAPRIVTGLNNAPILSRNGIGGVEELDWWGETAVGGAMVTYLPAHHFSARGIGDRGRSLWGGFAIRTAAGSILFAGDTAHGGHLAEIGAELGPFSIGMIPIGAYEPRWFMRAVHMNPEEAVRARAETRTRTAIAMHFGTFKLTQEGIDEPARALAEARSGAGLAEGDFIVPRFGQTITLPL